MMWWIDGRGLRERASERAGPIGYPMARGGAWNLLAAAELRRVEHFFAIL
jgi:hypothetical protein